MTQDATSMATLSVTEHRTRSKGATDPGCIICGGDTRRWLEVPGDWRRPEIENRYSLRWCDACRFGLLAPRPTADRISKFYDVQDYYTHRLHHNGLGAKLAGPSHLESALIPLMDRLREKLSWRADYGMPLGPQWLKRCPGNGPLRMCDIGCGSGAFLSILAEQGHDVIGVDPDADARQAARQRNLCVLDGTAEELPDTLPRGCYDIVYLQHVLEHCLDPSTALHNARDLLGPTGRVVIEVPNNDAAGLRCSRAAWHWLDVPRHLNFYTATSLAAHCAQVDLRVEAVQYTGYGRQFRDDWVRTEQAIYDLFTQRDRSLTARRNSRRRAWLLLLRTMFARRRFKYDSVRVVARRQE